MKLPNPISNCTTRAYTLVEALVASSILMIGVGAAASLSMTMVTQEEINHEVSRGLAYQEAAVRLYQLGLAPATAADLLPDEPSVKQLAFLAQTDEAINGVGTVRRKTIRVELTAGGVSPIHDVEAFRSRIDGEDVDTDVVRDFSSGAISGGFTSP